VGRVPTEGLLATVEGLIIAASAGCDENGESGGAVVEVGEVAEEEGQEKRRAMADFISRSCFFIISSTSSLAEDLK
jgi:hypothetical protein